MAMLLFSAMTFCVLFAFAKSGQTEEGTVKAHLSNAYVFQVPYRQQTIYDVNTQDSVQLRNGEKVMFVFPHNGHQQPLPHEQKHSELSFGGNGDKTSAGDNIYQSAQSTGVMSGSSHDNVKFVNINSDNFQNNAQTSGVSKGNSYDDVESTDSTTGSLQNNDQPTDITGGSLYPNAQSASVISGSSYDTDPSASAIGGSLYGNTRSIGVTGGSLANNQPAAVTDKSSYSNSQFTGDIRGSYDNVHDSSSSGTNHSPNYALSQGEKYNTPDSSRNLPNIYSQADNTNAFSSEKQFSHPSSEINLNVKQTKAAKKIPLVMITIQNKHKSATFDDTVNQSNYSQPLDQTVVDSKLNKKNEYPPERQDKSNFQRLPVEGQEWKPLGKMSYSIQGQGQTGRIFSPISNSYQVHSNQSPITTNIMENQGKVISQQAAIASSNLVHGYQQFHSNQPSNTYSSPSYRQPVLEQSSNVPKGNLPQLPTYEQSSISHFPNTYLSSESTRSNGNSNVSPTNTNYGQTHLDSLKKSKTSSSLQKNVVKNSGEKQATRIQSQPTPLNNSYKYDRQSFQNHQYSGLIQNTGTPKNIQQQSVYTFNTPTKDTENGQQTNSQSYDNVHTGSSSEKPSPNQIKALNTDTAFYNSYPNVQNRGRDTQRDKTTYEQNQSNRFVDNHSQQTIIYGNSNSANKRDLKQNGEELRSRYLKKQADFLLQNSGQHHNANQEYDDRRNMPQNQAFYGGSTYVNVLPQSTQNTYGSNQWQATSTAQRQGHGNFQEPRVQTGADPQFFNKDNKKASTYNQDSSLTLPRTSGDQRTSGNYYPGHQQPTNFENIRQANNEDNFRKPSEQQNDDYNRQEFRNQEVQQRPSGPANYESNSNYDTSFASGAYATEPQALSTATKSHSENSANSANDYERQKLSPEALLLVLVSTEKGGVREQIIFEDNYGQASEIVEFASPNLRSSEVLKNLRRAVENSQFSGQSQSSSEENTENENFDY